MSSLLLLLSLALAQEAPEAPVPVGPVEAAADSGTEGSADPSEAPEQPAPVAEEPAETEPEPPIDEPVEDAPDQGSADPEDGVDTPQDEAPGARPPDGQRPAPILEYGPELPAAEPEQPVDFVGPIPPSDGPVVVLPGPTPSDVVHDVLPWVAPRGFASGLLLLFLAVVFAGLAELFGRVRLGLADRGLLPTVSSAASLGSRVLAAFFALGCVAAWIPANVAPALPWVIVAGALAVGWSVRDVLPDLVAWLSLALEDRVRPGRWVSGAEFRGEVVRVGPRATLVLDEWGNEVSIPNRHLLEQPYRRDPSHWPKLEVQLTLDPALEPALARLAIREAVLLSPWIAPGDEVEIGASTDGSGQWSVHCRLLEGTYLAVFEGSLRERVLEVIQARS